MKKRILILFIVCSITNISYSFVALDTISIKGNIEFDSKELAGEFFYTIKNNDTASHDDWTLLVHPSVNILSINQNGQEADIKVQHGFGYRILTIEFPTPISANKRSTIFIKFSLRTQNTDPRLTINSNHVFLDARYLWFPVPDQDLEVNYNITITSPKEFHSIMGGHLVTDTIIINNRIAEWTNELDTLSLGSTLILTKKKKIQKGNFNIYYDDNRLAELIDEKLSPYWHILKKKHKEFPLSEIHIFPIDIRIPKEQKKYADGEFLGNLILLDKDLVNSALDTPSLDFHLSGNSEYRLIETLIHELYHSYFPGILKHQAEDTLFFESFVQYLTWALINEQDHNWGQYINTRTRFIIQNMYLSKKLNTPLWNFLLDTALLYSSFQNSIFNSYSLVDTLIEKYRFIELTKNDIQDTINQFYHLTTNTQSYTNNNSNLLHISKFHQLYNSSIQITKTNFNIIITNAYPRSKQSIVRFPVQTTSIYIEHNFPYNWIGSLVWVDNNNKKNYIPLSFSNNVVWETNLIGEINQIYTISPYDLLEINLADNFMIPDPSGLSIIEQLNKYKSPNDHIQIINDLDIIEKWQQDDLSIIWDHTRQYNNKFIIHAYLINKLNEIRSFILIEGIQNNDCIEIISIKSI